MAAEQATDMALGIEFLDAFEDAVDAHTERSRTMGASGFYDPCGFTEEHLTATLQEKLARLVKAIRAIK